MSATIATPQPMLNVISQGIWESQVRDRRGEGTLRVLWRESVCKAGMTDTTLCKWWLQLIKTYVLFCLVPFGSILLHQLHHDFIWLPPSEDILHNYTTRCREHMFHIYIICSFVENLYGIILTREQPQNTFAWERFSPAYPKEARRSALHLS